MLKKTIPNYFLIWDLDRSSPYSKFLDICWRFFAFIQKMPSSTFDLELPLQRYLSKKQKNNLDPKLGLVFFNFKHRNIETKPSENAGVSENPPHWITIKNISPK